MEPLISVILVWLSVTFGLPACSERPRVLHVQPSQLAAIHFGGARRGQDQSVLGAYDTRSQTILLRDDWDSRNPADVSVLVHELVHYLQHRDARNYECLGAREALAYEAQRRWLGLFGRDLEGDFGMDALTLKLRTSCLPH